MNSNRSSNQSQGKANGKNRPKNNKRKASAPPPAPAPPKKRARKQASVAAAYATGQSGQGAKVQQSKDSIRIVHREFIGNLTGSAAFAIASTFALNPGMAATFPWLAGIAKNWETYRFRSLRLCYYTRTGSNVPGSVILAHDPDSSDAAPATELVMTTYESVAEDAPWKDICLVLRALSMHDIGPRKFVRTGVLAANQDIKLYDSGNLFVGTVDGTAVPWGKLWVEYDVDLYTPQLPPSGASVAGTASNTAGTGSAAGSPLGTAITVLGSLIASVSTTDSTVTLQNLVVGSEYLVTGRLTGSTVNAFSGVVGMTLKTNLDGAGSTCNADTYTATASSGAIRMTTAGAGTNVFFTICELPTSAL